MSRLVAGVAAGVSAGLLAGVLARVLMRLITLAAGEEPGFSVAATFFIVALFVVAALPGAVLASFYRGRGRSALLIAGSLLLCVPATSIAAEELSGFGDLDTIQRVGVGAATVAIYAAVLTMPAVALWLIRRWSPGVQRQQGVAPAASAPA